MNKFIAISLVVSFILTVILIQPIIGYLRGRIMGAKISFPNCIMMSIRKTLSMNLIKAIAYSQNNSLNLDIAILEAHLLAGGDPLKCFEAMEYGKSKKLNLDFKLLSVADLVNKDLIDLINEASDNHTVNVCDSNIRDSKARSIDFEYTGDFKMDFSRACFGVSPDNDKLKDELKEKIRNYIEYSDTSDKENTIKIITETILDTKYWETKGLNLLGQELNIK